MTTEPETTDNELTPAEKVVEPAQAEADAPAAEQPAVDPEAPKPATKKRKASPAGQIVTGNAADDVRLSACVYKNAFARKSLSVYHVQRRLNELGYRDAYTDKNGWYGDLTLKAVKEYQADNGLAGDGLMTRETLDHLFSDDPNVQVVD